MFLLNNCKLLIFSDVRHGPRRRTKTPGIGELWRSKKCRVCVHVLGARSGESGVCAGRGDGQGLALGAGTAVAVAGLRGRGGRPRRRDGRGCGEPHPCGTAPKL